MGSHGELNVQRDWSLAVFGIMMGVELEADVSWHGLPNAGDALALLWVTLYAPDVLAAL